VALNMSDAAATVDVGTGTIRIATDRGLEGERVDGRVELAPWTGAVVS
jgi:hypothetical protein